MATKRTKWNCVCEERFVNYKAPDSISKYFYFETSSITSSRYLRGTVRYTVSSKWRRWSHRRLVSHRDMTWEWAGVSALWGRPPADGSQRTSILGCSSSGGTGLRCGTRLGTGPLADASSGCPQREPAHHWLLSLLTCVWRFTLPHFCLLFP